MNNNNSSVNALRFTNDELMVIGIMILMMLGHSLEVLQYLPIMVEEAVNSIPAYNASKKVAIGKLLEKVTKLKYGDLVKVFEDQTKNIVLPDFSYDEKIILGNCMCGTKLDGEFVQCLDMDVVDYIHYDLNRNVLVGEDHKFVVKVRSLDYAQRIKLLYLVKKEFFAKRIL